MFTAIIRDKLHRHVVREVVRDGLEYGADGTPAEQVGTYIRDTLWDGGLTGLTTIAQTTKFFREFRREINNLLGEKEEFPRVEGWRWDDPLALDVMNQDALARWAYYRVMEKMKEVIEDAG